MLTSRQTNILVEISNNPSINVKDLSEKVEGSEATIRRELNKLEKMNYLELSYGSIRLIKKENDELVNGENEHSNLTKDISGITLKIIEATTKEVHDGNVLLLPGNSYNKYIASLLVEQGRFITVVTNSSEIFDIVKNCSSINTILLGGTYNKDLKYFYGNSTLSFLSTIRADRFITCPSGIDFNLGFLESPLQDFHVLASMVNIARNNIVYLTEDVIKHDSGMLFSSFKEINTIIMEKKLYEKYKKEFILYDFNFILVEDSDATEIDN